MEASELAKRILGAQVCRALLASVIQVKIKGAAEIEATVRLCMQRDERSALHALHTMMQTIETEFLGLLSQASQDPLKPTGFELRKVNITPSHEIGGMMAHLAVARAHPPATSRTLAALAHVHANANDSQTLYFASECIYNLIRNADGTAKKYLNFENLFDVIARLWTRSGDASFDHARSILTTEVRQLARTEKIDLRDIILNNSECGSWIEHVPDLLIPWLDLLLAKYLQCLDRLLINCIDQREQLSKICSDLSRILIDLTDDQTQSANALVDFYSSAQSSVLELMSKNLLTTAPENIISLVCGAVTAPIASDLMPPAINPEIFKQFESILFKDPQISLSDDSWSVALKYAESSAETALIQQALIAHLLKPGVETIPTAANISYLKGKVIDWSHLLRNRDVTKALLDRVIHLLLEIGNKTEDAQRIRDITHGLEHRDVIELYLVFRLCLQARRLDPGTGMHWSAKLLASTALKPAEGIKLSFTTDPQDAYESMEALVYLLEQPEALPYRHFLHGSEFYKYAFAWLDADSAYFRVAQNRAASCLQSALRVELNPTFQPMARHTLAHITKLSILRSLCEPSTCAVTEVVSPESTRTELGTEGIAVSSSGDGEPSSDVLLTREKMSGATLTQAPTADADVDSVPAVLNNEVSRDRAVDGPESIY